jgi:hypothetical protein
VCDLSKDEMREYRGTLTEPGRNSPWRDRSVEENLDLFERMKKGEFPDGSRTLRAKWEKPDWTPPNLPCSGKAPFQSGNRLWRRVCKPGFRMKRRKP